MTRWQRIILFPIGWLYGVVIAVRNWLYDVGLLRTHVAPLATICIGNIAVGGTGKTPMTEHLVSILQDKYAIAVLSRGYKRRSHGFVLADGNSTAQTLGDEMMQVHSKFPNIPVAVCEDRRKGIKRLKKAFPRLQCVILDDAFQHRRLTCGMNILLTTHDNLYINDYLLPYGSLRDSKRQAKRADVIIVTKCPHNLTGIDKRMIINKLNPLPYQQVLFSYLQTQEVKLSGTPLIIAGIAQPQPFLDAVRSKYPEAPILIFPDHHNFTSKDIENIVKKSKKCNCIATTEKDFARLQTTILPKKIDIPIVSIPVAMQIFPDCDSLEQIVVQYLNEVIKNKKKE